MIVKTLGSQKGSPAAAEEGAEGRGGGRGEGGERRVSASKVDVGSKLLHTFWNFIVGVVEIVCKRDNLIPIDQKRLEVVPEPRGVCSKL